MSGLVARMTSWASRRYKETLGARLKAYGLRYDDLFDPVQDEDIKEALRRLPQDVVLARNARLKRAMDLSMKHEHLPKELQEKQTPFDHYMLATLNEVKAERAERSRLGAAANYQRTLP